MDDQAISASLLVLAITASPVMAGSNEAKPGSESAANTTPAEETAGPAPNLILPAGEANVTALLGVLVMKGVLAPNEANAIRNAAPSAQFQALVEALSRKGVVNAADLSAIAEAKPVAHPATAAGPVAMALSTQTSQPVAQILRKQNPRLPQLCRQLCRCGCCPSIRR